MLLNLAYPLQLISCFIMTGVIAVIQLIHYPSFFYIDRSQFEVFHRKHTAALGFIAAPTMCVELFSGFALATSGNLWWILNFVVIVVLWLITFLVSVPAHNRLAAGFNESDGLRLVNTNWLRTLLWVGRSVAFATIWILSTL